MAGGGAPHWPDVRWARHKSSAKPRKRCGCRLELITQRRVWLTADHALDRICLIVPVDAHLDRLFLFNGSGPRVAVIPPALVLIALMFTWLWKRLVVRIAGESEP